MAHHEAGRLAEAAECYRRIAAADPEYDQARYMLGVIAHQEGRLDEAVEAYRRALARAPDFVDGHSNLGNALQELGRFDDAMVAYRAALALDPARAGIWYAAGVAEAARQHFVAAMQCYRKALALTPGWHEAQHNLGHMLFNLGQIDEALAMFRQAASGRQAELPRSMIAVLVPGSPTSTNQDIFDARRAFAADLPRPRSVLRARHDRLRVGYVSSFFHRRNWMKPVWGLINQHDRERVDVHLFTDSPPDVGYRPHRRDTIYDMSGQPNEMVADAIERAGIDVLVDLNGYSAMRRLPLMALKPAPVLVGWFNIFATTGVAGYDYLIGDAVVVPAEEERYYCERIVRVPGSYLTFEVGYPVPDIMRRSSRPVTFGCLAPLYKITPEVVAAWCRILRGAPASRLILKSTAFAGKEERRFVRDEFGDCGERVEIEGPDEHYEFLRTYDRIDIALDTFPYNGGTTTTEAIWQGVPVLTFWGDRWVARTSASILRAGGLAEWVTSSADAYVTRAIALANGDETPEMLRELRLTMREQLARSPVCDTPGFARQMEAIYFG
jgi:protein O-GlcNAc transferase